MQAKPTKHIVGFALYVSYCITIVYMVIFCQARCPSKR
jgi:hypothetical protein